MMRCACGHVIAHACPHGDDERSDRRHAPLEATRRAYADQRSHEQAHVEGARVDEQSFEDVGVPAQMRPPHAPGLVEMGVGAFEAFAPLALQGSAPCAADAAAIGVHRVSRRGRAPPAPSAALGFGNVRAQVQRRQIHQDLVAVRPLVGDDLLAHAGVLGCRRGHRFEVLGEPVPRARNLTSIARAPHAQRRQRALDGDQVCEDLDDRQIVVHVGVRPPRDLVQVRADARDLPGALALDLARRHGPGLRPRHRLAQQLGQRHARCGSLSLPDGQLIRGHAGVCDGGATRSGATARHLWLLLGVRRGSAAIPVGHL